MNSISTNCKSSSTFGIPSKVLLIYVKALSWLIVIKAATCTVNQQSHGARFCLCILTSVPLAGGVAFAGKEILNQLRCIRYETLGITYDQRMIDARISVKLNRKMGALFLRRI